MFFSLLYYIKRKKTFLIYLEKRNKIKFNILNIYNFLAEREKIQLIPVKKFLMRKDHWKLDRRMLGDYK